MEHYIIELKNWLDKVVPTIINEEYFLWAMGSLFLFGIVTKWIVMRNYERLIKKAENMAHPKNKTLREIKMKYESIKQVNGTVANPLLLVQRYLNRCRATKFSLKTLNNISEYCAIVIIGLSGLLGFELYQTGAGKTTAMSYIITGCFFAFTLATINRCVNVNEKKTELSYVIVDVLENNAMSRQERREEELMDLMQNQQNSNEKSMNFDEKTEPTQEEIIVNQVIGEFLQ